MQNAQNKRSKDRRSVQENKMPKNVRGKNKGDMEKFYKISNHIAKEYSLSLLNWAYHKLGDRNRAEDLAQEALLQIFAAVKKACDKGEMIESEERLVWKIAHYVWCHYLRQKTHLDKLVFVEAPEAEDESDFVREFADAQEREELKCALRKYIARLDFLQREILISFYLDRCLQSEIAERLKISVGMVKWHLFETRKKLRKELEFVMETGRDQDYVYRPKQLRMGICGQAVAQLDTKKFEESLVRQNICIACYEEPKNLDEMAGMLGSPKAYLVFVLLCLVEKEFVTEKEGRYSTSFLISTKEEQFGYYEIYYKLRRELSARIIDELCAAEGKLREIGFYGSDAPMEKLLWLLIYRFENYFLQKKENWVGSANAPVRPDGGRYFPLGFVREEVGVKAQLADFVKRLKAQNLGGEPGKFIEDVFNWSYNGSMNSDNFYWFGLYDFGISEIENLIDEFTPYWEHLHFMLCTILHSDFDISWIGEDRKDQLAQLVEKGFVRIEGNKAFPNFVIFTEEQYKKLIDEIFEPLAQNIESAYNKLKAEFERYYTDHIPAHLAEYRELKVNSALGDMAWITTIFAFEDGKLLAPENHLEREFLTLMYLLR